MASRQRAGGGGGCRPVLGHAGPAPRGWGGLPVEAEGRGWGGGGCSSAGGITGISIGEGTAAHELRRWWVRKKWRRLARGRRAAATRGPASRAPRRVNAREAVACQHIAQYGGWGGGGRTRTRTRACCWDPIRGIPATSAQPRLHALTHGGVNSRARTPDKTKSRGQSSYLHITLVGLVRLVEFVVWAKRKVVGFA